MCEQLEYTFKKYTNNRVKNLTRDLNKHPNNQQAHEKALSITYHQLNANQNQNEITPHIS